MIRYPIWKDLAEDFSLSLPSISTDIKETPEKYIFEMELPGFLKDEIKISLENNNLKVSASREEKNQEDESGKNLKIERKTSYARNYYLPNSVNEKDIEATYENGILVVEVKKKEKEKERLIKIK